MHKCSGEQTHTQTHTHSLFQLHIHPVHKIKTQSETTPMECAEIKGIKSHGAPAAVEEERVVPKVTVLAAPLYLTH